MNAHDGFQRPHFLDGHPKLMLIDGERVAAALTVPPPAPPDVVNGRAQLQGRIVCGQDLGPDGKEILRNEDLPGTTDAGLDFTVPSDGAYHLAVSDAAGAAGQPRRMGDPRPVQRRGRGRAQRRDVPRS